MRVASYLSREEMAGALTELEQALYVHEQWCNNIACTLICHLAPDERDIADEPHRSCQFGQWYYSQQNHKLAQHPAFIAVENEHQHMHRVAASMLRTAREGAAIAIRDYEAYTSAVARMRSEIFSLKRELEDGLTNLDPLTGTTTRIGMLTKLRAQHELATRGVQSCAIAMMDIDHFKHFNDGFGHKCGDDVLVGVASLLIEHLRPYDEVFRYGGEEFLLCLPGVGLDEGGRTVERLRALISALEVVGPAGEALRVTASFGVTLLDPDVAVEESIARADRTLYRAKAEGRDRARVWDPSVDVSSS